MKIEYIDTLPSKPEYLGLFETTGWNKIYNATSDELHAALKRSWHTVSAYESDQLVGFGRIVSDGVLYAMIYDIIVRPSHQCNGIASAILAKLVDKCRAAGIRDVQLFAAPGKADFYTKRGFQKRPENAPGMRLPREKKC